MSSATQRIQAMSSPRRTIIPASRAATKTTKARTPRMPSRASKVPTVSFQFSNSRDRVKGRIMIRNAATKMAFPILEATRVVTSPPQGRGSRPKCWTSPYSAMGRLTRTATVMTRLSCLLVRIPSSMRKKMTM